MGVCVCLQVSPLGYLVNGPYGDQDGSFNEEQEIPGGAEMQDIEEDLNRERRRYVAFIHIISLMLFK